MGTRNETTTEPNSNGTGEVLERCSELVNGHVIDDRAPEGASEEVDRRTTNESETDQHLDHRPGAGVW